MPMPVSEDRSIYYRDCAIIRFIDGPIKVVSDTEFINDFKKRESSDFWKTIDCV
jgi:hypothetical protein